MRRPTPLAFFSICAVVDFVFGCIKWHSVLSGVGAIVGGLPLMAVLFFSTGRYGRAMKAPMSLRTTVHAVVDGNQFRSMTVWSKRASPDYVKYRTRVAKEARGGSQGRATTRPAHQSAMIKLNFLHSVTRS
jgi:hypothetical protein